MRLHHYLAAASGNQTQAILEAQNLVNNAEQQIQSALRDVNGAINYIIDGVKTHPNRIDICKRQPGNAPNQAPALALSQLSGPAPNRPSVFGVPSAITGPQPGASSNLGNLTSNSGQPPSVFGKPSAFGIPQPINLTQPSTAFSNPSSAFDRPSTSSGGPPAPFGAPPLGGTGPAFGGNTAFGGTNPTPSAFAIPQPVPPAAAPSVSPFVQPTNPFGRSQQLAQPSAFGMPANTPPSNPIGQPPAPTTNGSIFGKPQSGQPPTANGPSVQRDDQNKLTVWHGRPVSYIDGDPCYKRRDGTWEKIWFPNGPLTSHSDTQLPDEAYDEKTKEAYIFMKEHKAFKDGIMPEIPPKREWCSWDF